MIINSVGSTNALNPISSGITNAVGGEEGSSGFGDYLKDALNKVNDMVLESDTAADEFAAGKTDNIHQVMISMEKADIALQLTMQIRNKVMDAYNEIMRMQI